MVDTVGFYGTTVEINQGKHAYWADISSDSRWETVGTSFATREDALEAARLRIDHEY